MIFSSLIAVLAIKTIFGSDFAACSEEKRKKKVAQTLVFEDVLASFFFQFARQLDLCAV